MLKKKQPTRRRAAPSPRIVQVDDSNIDLHEEVHRFAELAHQHLGDLHPFTARLDAASSHCDADGGSMIDEAEALAARAAVFEAPPRDRALLFAGWHFDPGRISVADIQQAQGASVPERGISIQASPGRPVNAAAVVTLRQTTAPIEVFVRMGAGRAEALRCLAGALSFLVRDWDRAIAATEAGIEDDRAITP